MTTTKLHTLEEILTEGITIETEDGKTERIKVSCMLIPKIQRSYAQGRKSENNIRKDFLDDIFSALKQEECKPLELSFIFGSKQNLINGTPDGFELLDGQQRTTTLFLLYWYLNTKENKSLPDFLSKFTYETRDTSSDFLSKITSNKFYLNNKKPSDVLKANKWFTDDYYCDPTISSMLNMLDDIDERYRKLEQPKLLQNLGRLQFYVLLLEKFDMNDELYIKMNSRGLSLTPFENFKASVVRYMKKDGLYGNEISTNGEMPYWLSFTTNIDAKWIDIFWLNPTEDNHETINGEIRIDDAEIGCTYFRFFNRYFFTKAAILKGVKNGKAHPLPSFFYKDCEKADIEERLKGWENYEELFNLIREDNSSSDKSKDLYPPFSAIERILNVFRRYYFQFILEAIQADPYGNTTDFDIFSKDGFTLYHRIVFAAVTEFIETMPQDVDFDKEDVKINFRRLLRITHNVIENTTIESDVAAIGVINSIAEIIHLPGATNGNLYSSLANNEIKSRNSQLLEEKEKAAEIANSDDPEWENAFITAEKHPFFKGSIRFFFTPNGGSCVDFQNRYSIIKDLFDKNGITTEYRGHDHLLIRALLSCLNHWDSSGMENRYFTENNEKEKYLKNIVTGNESVRKMFCNYFNDTQYQQHISIKDYLKEIVTNASCRVDETNTSFIMLYKRLINDNNSAAIYDEIAKQEEKGCFRIQNNRSYCILIPGKWYNQLILDTERNIIISSLVKDYGFFYENKHQKETMEGSLNDAFGWRIKIVKDVNINDKNYTIVLDFNEYKSVDFYVKSNNISELERIFNIPRNPINDSIELPSIQYQYDKDKQNIIDYVEDIETKIHEYRQIVC